MLHIIPKENCKTINVKGLDITAVNERPDYPTITFRHGLFRLDITGRNEIRLINKLCRFALMRKDTPK
jgi:hypothetical protein